MGFITWAYTVPRLRIAAATTALYLVPVVAVTISAAWLGEIPHPLEILGGTVVIGGLALNRH